MARRSATVIAGVGAAAGAAAGAAVVAMTKRSAEAIDKTAKLSDELGITTQALIAYQHQAGLTGTSNSTLSKGLQILVRRLGEAKAGYGEGRKALDALGLTVDDLRGKTTEQIFARVVDDIKALPDATSRAAAAFALFGRQGQEMMNFILAGADGMRQARAEADRLNATYSRMDAARVEAANDAVARSSKAVSGAFDQLAIAVAPTIKFAADALTEFLTEAIDVRQWAQAFQRTITIVSARILGIAETTRGALTLLAGVSEMIEEPFARARLAAARLQLSIADAGSTVTRVFADIARSAKTIQSLGAFFPGMGRAAKTIAGAADELESFHGRWADLRSESVAAVRDLERRASMQTRWADSLIGAGVDGIREGMSRGRRAALAGMSKINDALKIDTTGLREGTDTFTASATDAAGRALDAVARKAADAGRRIRESLRGGFEAFDPTLIRQLSRTQIGEIARADRERAGQDPIVRRDQRLPNPFTALAEIQHRAVSALQTVLLRIGQIDVPTAAQPTIDVPTAAQPMIDVPTAAQPTIDVPTAARPTIDVPTAARPIIDVPTAAQPIIDVPTAARPTIDVPTAARPIIDVPTAAQPIIDVPTAARPTIDMSRADARPTQARAAIERTASQVQRVEDRKQHALTQQLIAAVQAQRGAVAI
jgi:hypothetical protein